MTDTHVMPPADREALHGAARDLHTRFRGVFGEETIAALLLASYRDLAATATVHRWLAIGAERFAAQRLAALAHAEHLCEGATPAVLFMCAHNAARSQMALGWFTSLARGRAVGWSVGSEPAYQIDPASAAVMAEVGIDITGEFAKPWAIEFLRAADVVVTMGCGDACPLVTGKRYEDWEMPDPRDRPLAEVRLIRDQIRDQVGRLLASLGI